jgi:energy-coupling factor transport system ATP-binding protein
MMKELRARGLPVDTAVFTVEDALKEVLRLKSTYETENNGN